MSNSYLEHEKNFCFFQEHLRSVGIEPEKNASGETVAMTRYRAVRSGYGRPVVALWLIGYARSKEGMLTHARSE
jgi:hypothetical protein